MSEGIIVKQGMLVTSSVFTGNMRWYRGHVLQQQWSVTTYDCGVVDGQRLEWRDVPQAEDV